MYVCISHTSCNRKLCEGNSFLTIHLWILNFKKWEALWVVMNISLFLLLFLLFCFLAFFFRCALTWILKQNVVHWEGLTWPDVHMLLLLPPRIHIVFGRYRYDTYCCVVTFPVFFVPLYLNWKVGYCEGPKEWTTEGFSRSSTSITSETLYGNTVIEWWCYFGRDF